MGTALAKARPELLTVVADKWLIGPPWCEARSDDAD